MFDRMSNNPIQTNQYLINVINSHKQLFNLDRVVLLHKKDETELKGLLFNKSKLSELPPLKTNLDELTSDKKALLRHKNQDNQYQFIFEHFNLDVLLPLNTSDKKCSFLGITKHDKQYSSTDLDAVQLLSKNIEQIIHNEFLTNSLDRSNKQTQKMISEMGALHEISRMFESVLNLDALLKYVLEKCMNLMNAEAASSMMVVEGTDELEFKIVLGPNAEGVKPFRLKIGKGISGWVAENNEPILIPDAYDDPRFDPSFDKRSGFRTRSMLCVPLTYKSKPIGVMTILNRLDGNPFTESDKNLLTTFASQAALAIENTQLLQAAIEKERLDKELQVAAEIQQLIIPQTIPDVPGLEISATYIPCKEVSGDFYDIIPINENECVFVVADVSGKGIPGAMLVSTMQATLKAYLEYSTELLSIITNLNDRIMKNTTEDRFITFFFGLYNAKDSTFTYINAGHNPPILVQNDRKLEKLKTGGIFIGCMPWTYEIAKIDLPAGSILTMYTDGLVEAMDNKNEEFGEQRLEEVLLSNFNASMDDLKQEIITGVKTHLSGNILDDDFTLLLVKKK